MASPAVGQIYPVKQGPHADGTLAPGVGLYVPAGHTALTIPLHVLPGGQVAHVLTSLAIRMNSDKLPHETAAPLQSKARVPWPTADDVPAGHGIAVATVDPAMQ